jgi:hypothetical protein
MKLPFPVFQLMFILSYDSLLGTPTICFIRPMASISMNRMKNSFERVALGVLLITTLFQNLVLVLGLGLIIVYALR